MTIINKSITFATSLLLVASITVAANSAHAFSENEFQHALKTFKLPDEKNNFEQAALEFKTLLTQEPSNPVLMAYSGAATSRLATTTILPWKKMSYAEDGLAQIDKALQLAKTASNQSSNLVQDEVHVKFVAANTFLALPDFFNRKSRGEQLLKDIVKPEFLNLVNPGLKGEILLRAAEWANKNQQSELAKNYLQQVIDSKAPQADQAKSLLKGKSA